MHDITEVVLCGTTDFAPR